MAPSGWRARAMLLESSADAAGILRGCLQKAGVEVVEWVRLGTGWVANWQKVQPDLVFIDLQLPRRDGFFCLEKVLELDPQSLIVFTHCYQGLIANEVETRALALGACGVLQKPFVESRVTVGVDRAIRQLSRHHKIKSVKL